MELKSKEDLYDSPAKLESFEDMLNIVGTTGRRNILIFIVCMACAFISPFSAVSYQFLGATPDFWCHIGSLVDANWTENQIQNLSRPPSREEKGSCVMYNINYTEAAYIGYEESLQTFDINSTDVIGCLSRNFDNDEAPTVVTQWDLVCERRYLYSTTQAMAPIGGFFGSIIWGYFLDVYGRRKIVLTSIISFFVVGHLMATVLWLEIYLFLKMCMAFFSNGIYVGGFIITMEICSISQRSYIGSFFAIPWALGYMIVPGIAYLVRPWHWLIVALTSPVLLLFPHFWLLPESPRWLIINGKYDEAILILSKIAQSNNRQLPPKDEITKFMEKLYTEEQKKKAPTGSRNILKILKKFVLRISVLLRKPQFRTLTFMVFLCWASVAMVYYGISLNSSNIGANTYQYIFFGGLLEVPAYIAMWPLVVFLGRKKTLVASYLSCSLSILAIMLLMLINEDAELYPTKMRPLAIGEASVIARFGGVCSPYINDILGDLYVWAPSAVFGVASVAAGFVSMFIPETGGKNLQEMQVT